MKPLPIFPANPPLSSRWEQWFQKEGYVPVPYDPQNPQEVEVLLLLAPAHCAGLWLSIENVWSHHFLKRNLNTRLIQVGIKGHESRPNYLHLYHLPLEFSTFLDHSKTVSQDWEPISSGLTELSDRIRLFFEGHGNDGFWHWLAEVRRFLNFLPVNQPDITPENIRELLRDPVKQSQVDTMKRRWAHFSDIFTCLPDQRFVPEVDALLESLKIQKILQAEDGNLVDEIHHAQRLAKLISEKLEPLQASILPESAPLIEIET